MPYTAKRKDVSTAGCGVYSMIEYVDAAKKAKAMFTEAGYKQPLVGAQYLRDRWLFYGVRINGPDYRLQQIAVDKATGEAKWYCICDPRNDFEDIGAPKIDIPEDLTI